MDNMYTAVELLKKSAEIEKHLEDEFSRRMYEMRLKYLITRNKSEYRSDMLKLFEENKQPEESELDKIYNTNGKINSVVIFGSGQDGHFVLGLLNQTNYKDKNIVFCDNNEAKWNTKVAGVKVISPNELIANHRDSIVIIATNQNKFDIYNQLAEMKYPLEQVLLLNAGGGEYSYLFGLSHIWRIIGLDSAFDFYDENEHLVIFADVSERKHVLNLLRHSIFKNKNILFCDDKCNSLEDVKTISWQELISNYRNSIVVLTGKRKDRENLKSRLLSANYPSERIFNLPHNDSSLAMFINGEYFDYFKPNEHEIFVDAGCYNGQTAVEFSHWAEKGYDYIYSFEANPDMIEICEDTFKKHKLKGEVIPKGLWYKEETLNFNPSDNDPEGARINPAGTSHIETTSLDKVLNGKRVTFIKMDIEGAEFKALLGAKQTIKKWNPRLAICIYHKPEDILEIPALLLEFNPNYKFVIRQYTSNLIGTILYAYSD